MKRWFFVLAAVAAVMLAGCTEKEDDIEDSVIEQLQGSWRPVYAKSWYEDAVFRFEYDGPLNEDGMITCQAIDKKNPSVRYETQVLYPGIKFFRESEKDLFLNFFLNPSLMPSSDFQPFEYYIIENIIYFELPKGVFINGLSTDWRLEGSYRFNDGNDLEVIDKNTIRIGGVTYNRMR